MVCKSFNFRRGLPCAADCSQFFENLMNPLNNKQILLLWSSMLGNYVALTLLVTLVYGASSETRHSGHDNLQYRRNIRGIKASRGQQWRLAKEVNHNVYMAWE